MRKANMKICQRVDARSLKTSEFHDRVQYTFDQLKYDLLIEEILHKYSGWIIIIF